MTYTVKQLSETESNFKAASEHARLKTRTAEDLEEQHEDGKVKADVVRKAHDEAHDAHKVAVHAYHNEIHRLNRKVISAVNQHHNIATVRDTNSKNHELRKDGMANHRDNVASMMNDIADHSSEAHYHFKEAAGHKRSSELI